MISKVRITLDIPIKHHIEASEVYIRTAVLESVYNQETSISSKEPKKSYSIMRDTFRQAIILPNTKTST